MQIKPYLDPALAAKAIYGSEAPTNSTYQTPTTMLELGPRGLFQPYKCLGRGSDIRYSLLSVFTARSSLAMRNHEIHMRLLEYLSCTILGFY